MASSLATPWSDLALLRASRPRARSGSPPGAQRALRIGIVAAQAVTIGLAWPLFQARLDPPTLPTSFAALLPLPALDYGVALLMSLGLALLRPRAGAWLHAALLLLACLADQTRIQPQLLSLALLLLACSGSRPMRTVGLAHLAALYVWAGLHKVLSPSFALDTGPWLLRSLWSGAPGWALPVAGQIGWLELGLGLAILWPRARRSVAPLLLLLHLGILLLLSPFGVDLDRSVWPWNLALALVALSWLPSRRAPIRAELRGLHGPHALAIAALWVGPLGFYLGSMDATPSGSLYASDVSTSLRCDAEGLCTSGPESRESRARLGVAFPPEPRLYRARFYADCVSGERLVLSHPARWPGERWRTEEIFCPDREER